MNTQSESPSNDPQSPSSNSSRTRRGRRRKLDDARRREICAFVAGGCGLRDAARYVGCDMNTIRREARRNPDFRDQLRRSEAYAQLSPLRAMQSAVGTHWRAAAWMLERAYPDRFARPEPGAFGARQARQLMNEALHIISTELADPIKFNRIEKRIRGAFEYHIRAVCDRRRTSRDLRRAMSVFDDKNRATDPLAEYGIVVPDFDTLMQSAFHPPIRHSRTGASPPAPSRKPSQNLPGGLNPATMKDLTAALRETISTLSPGAATKTPPTTTSNDNNP